MSISRISSASPNQRDYAIDGLRLLCAFMVVYIHTRYKSGFFLDICRCAVPCFLVISGYYLYSNDTLILKKRVIKGLKRIFEIYLWCLLLYGALTIRFAVKQNDFSVFSLGNCIKFFVYGESDFLYFAPHLWYLHTYLYALVIIYFFNQFKCVKCLAYLSPILLMMNLEVVKEFISPLVGTYHLPLYLTISIPYVMMGMSVKKYRWFFQKVNSNIVLCGIVCSLVLLYYEDGFWVSCGINANDKYIMTICLTFFIFVLSIMSSNNHKNILSRIGEEYSLYVYVFHTFILWLFYGINDNLPSLWSEMIFPHFAPVIVFLSTIVFAILFRALKNTKVLDSFR